MFSVLLLKNRGRICYKIDQNKKESGLKNASEDGAGAGNKEKSMQHAAG